MRGRETRRGRDARVIGLGPIPALVLACVWSLGFEVVPLAHAIEHATTPSGTHCHDGACHDDDEGSGISSTDHGDHTLAHRDVAASAPPPAIVRWPATFVADALDELRIEGAIAEIAPRPPTARGPPRA